MLTDAERIAYLERKVGRLMTDNAVLSAELMKRIEAEKTENAPIPLHQMDADALA